jgi:hypothetical protein
MRDPESVIYEYLHSAGATSNRNLQNHYRDRGGGRLYQLRKSVGNSKTQQKLAQLQVPHDVGNMLTQQLSYQNHGDEQFTPQHRTGFCVL